MRIFLFSLALFGLFYSSLAWGNQACNQLLVARIGYDIFDEDIRYEFSAYGTVVEARVVLGAGGRSKGFAIVTMADCQSAAKAIQALNESIVFGRQIAVTLVSGARNQRPTSSRGGGYGNNRGSYGGGGYRKDDNGH